MKTCSDIDRGKKRMQISFVLFDVDKCSLQIVSILSLAVKVFKRKMIKMVKLLMLLKNLPLSHCIKFVLG